MTTSKTAAPHKAVSANKDAIALLKADHEAVGHLFAEYEKTRSVANKKSLVAEICTALSVHAQIEEEIFYPAVRAVLKREAWADDGVCDHAACTDLIAELDEMWLVCCASNQCHRFDCDMAPPSGRGRGPFLPVAPATPVQLVEVLAFVQRGHRHLQVLPEQVEQRGFDRRHRMDGGAQVKGLQTPDRKSVV